MVIDSDVTDGLKRFLKANTAPAITTTPMIIIIVVLFINILLRKCCGDTGLIQRISIRFVKVLGGN